MRWMPHIPEGIRPSEKQVYAWLNWGGLVFFDVCVGCHWRVEEGQTIAVTEETQMETAIGVFASRDHAEKAVKELRELGVPEEAMVFLTRSETEAKTIAKQFGAY